MRDIVVSSTSDIYALDYPYLAKFDSLGNYRWFKSAAPPPSTAFSIYGIEETCDGNMLFSYEFDDSVIGVAKLDTSASYIWSFGLHTETGYINDFCQLADSSIILTIGFFSGIAGEICLGVIRITKDGALSWSKRICLFDAYGLNGYLTALSNTDFLVSSRLSAGCNQYLFRFDTLGNCIWGIKDTLNYTWVHSVELESGLIGSTCTTNKMRQLDSSGNVLWTVDAEDDACSSLKLIGNGSGYILGGYLNGAILSSIDTAGVGCLTTEIPPSYIDTTITLSPYTIIPDPFYMVFEDVEFPVLATDSLIIESVCP